MPSPSVMLVRPSVIATPRVAFAARTSAATSASKPDTPPPAAVSGRGTYLEKVKRASWLAIPAAVIGGLLTVFSLNPIKLAGCAFGGGGLMPLIQGLSAWKALSAIPGILAAAAMGTMLAVKALVRK